MSIFLIVLSAVLLTITHSQTNNGNTDTILSYKTEQKDNGYYFQYSTSNGLHREETGTFLKRNSDENSLLLQVHGQYSYISPDGQLHAISYTADENGYKQEEGENHLQPLPPTITTLPPLPIYKPPQTQPPPAAPISTSAIASLTGGGLG